MSSDVASPKSTKLSTNKEHENQEGLIFSEKSDNKLIKGFG